MPLIDRLQARRAAQGGEGGGGGALAVAVVHDRDSGFEAVDEDGVVARRQAVVVSLIDIHFAHDVFWADQPHLLVPGQVAAVIEAEGPKLDQRSNAVKGVAFDACGQ